MQHWPKDPFFLIVFLRATQIPSQKKACKIKYIHAQCCLFLGKKDVQPYRIETCTYTSILLDHMWWHKLTFKQMSKSTMPIDSEHSYKYSWYCNLFCKTIKHRTQMLTPRKRMGTWYRRYSTPPPPPPQLFFWLCCNVCIQDIYENLSAQPPKNWEYAHQHTYRERQI